MCRDRALGCFLLPNVHVTRTPRVQDKYIVNQSPSDKEIWWGDVNRPMKPEVFDKLYSKVTDHYNKTAKKMYVFDGYCGANLKTQKKGALRFDL